MEGKFRLAMRDVPRPIVLALDAAGSGCSVAVGVGERIVNIERVEITHGHAERILSMADDALSRAGLPPSALDLVAVTVGPGSFTGIRVGLATAKGITLATGARLAGVSSFDAVAAVHAKPGCFLLVALESRREDLYVQLFGTRCDSVGKPATTAAGLADLVHAAIGKAPLRIAGDAAPRAAVLLAGRPLTTVLEDTPPDAIGALRAALCQLRRGEENTAARPLYIRTPNVTLSAEHRNPNLRQA